MRDKSAAGNLLARFPRPSSVAYMATNTTPASMLAIPKHFGRRPDAVFLPAHTPDERVLSESARIQHAAAVAVLDELALRDLSLAWLAGELGENSDHLRRKLYGQVPARLRDLCAWGAAKPSGTCPPRRQCHSRQPGGEDRYGHCLGVLGQTRPTQES
jgi:hypothetical protein